MNIDPHMRQAIRQIVTHALEVPQMDVPADVKQTLLQTALEAIHDVVGERYCDGEPKTAGTFDLWLLRHSNGDWVHAKVCHSVPIRDGVFALLGETAAKRAAAEYSSANDTVTPVCVEVSHD